MNGVTNVNISELTLKFKKKIWSKIMESTLFFYLSYSSNGIVIHVI